MQINVCGPPACSAAPAFSVSSLQAAIPAAYGATQAQPIAKQAAYNQAFNSNFSDHYVQNVDATVNPSGVGQGVSAVKITLPGSGYVATSTVSFVPMDGVQPTQAAV